MAHDVFVSYSSKDTAAAEKVLAALESAGVRCWMAPRDISPGLSWPAAIVKAIEGSRALVLVFSADADASEQIKREVAQAVQRGLPLLPVRIENVQPSADMAYFLVTPHWLDAYAPPLENHLEYVVGTVKKLLGGPPPAVRQAPANKSAAGGRKKSSPVLLVSAVAILLLVATFTAWRWLKPKDEAAATGSNPSTAPTSNGAVLPVPTPMPGPGSVPAETAKPPIAAPSVVVPTATTTPSIPFAAPKISSKTAGADPASAVPLAVGEVVTGRLNGSDQRGNTHFWKVDLPPGNYRTVLDLRTADGRSGVMTVDASWLTDDGQDGDRVLFISEAGFEHRSAANFAPKLPIRRVLRVSNSQSKLDYWLSVVPNVQPIAPVRFADTPVLTPLEIGKPQTVQLDQEQFSRYATHYLVKLPPGDYRVTMEMSSENGQEIALVGSVDLLDAEGFMQKADWIFESVAAATSKKSATLQLRGEEAVILRLRGGMRGEYLTLRLDR